MAHRVMFKTVELTLTIEGFAIRRRHPNESGLRTLETRLTAAS
jgi:hypothetical protein